MMNRLFLILYYKNIFKKSYPPHFQDNILYIYCLNPSIYVVVLKKLKVGMSKIAKFEIILEGFSFMDNKYKVVL